MSTSPDYFEQPPAEGFAGWLLLVLGIGGVVAALALHRTAVVLPMGPGLLLGMAIAAGGAWLAPQTAALSIVVRFIYHLHYAIIAGFVSVALVMPLAATLDDFLLRQICVAGFAMSAPWTIAHLMANASGRRRVSVAYAGLTTVVCLCAMHASAWVWPLLLGAAVGLVRFVPSKLEGEPPTVVGPIFNATAFLLFNGIVLMGAGPLCGLFVRWAYGAADPDSNMQLTPLTEALAGSEGTTAPGVLLALRWIGLAVGFLVPLVLAVAWPRSSTIGQRPRALTGAVLCLCAAGLIGGQGSLPTAIAALAVGTVLIGAAAAAILPIADGISGRLALGVLGGAVGGTILMQCAAVVPSDPIWGLALWLGEAVVLAAAWLLAYTTGIAWLRKREE